MIFDKEIAQIRKLKDEVIEEVRKIINDNSETLVRYIKEDQLSIGKDGSDNDIGQYSLGYKPVRINAGLQVAYVDLNFSGDFYATIEVVAESDGVHIKSDVSYDKHLLKRYGKDILKVSRANFIKFSNEVLKPQLKQRLNDRITRS